MVKDRTKRTLRALEEISYRHDMMANPECLWTEAEIRRQRRTSWMRDGQKQRRVVPPSGSTSNTVFPPALRLKSPVSRALAVRYHLSLFAALQHNPSLTASEHEGMTSLRRFHNVEFTPDDERKVEKALNVLRKYATKKHVKGVVVSLDSGVVLFSRFGYCCS